MRQLQILAPFPGLRDRAKKRTAALLWSVAWRAHTRALNRAKAGDWRAAHRWREVEATADRWMDRLRMTTR